MEKFKKVLLGAVVGGSVLTFGYQYAKNFVDFKEPILTDKFLMITLIFWILLAMIGIYKVAYIIRKHRSDKEIKEMVIFFAIIIAFNIGYAIANLNVLFSSGLTIKEIVSFAVIPLNATFICGLLKKS